MAPDSRQSPKSSISQTINPGNPLLQGRLPSSSVAVVVLIPCYNEQATIGKVVDDFRRELTDAHIIVFDNCSTDSTAAVAAQHGAIIVQECRKGKGFVVDSMFDGIEADVFVMVDGDDTYPAEKVHDLLEPILQGKADIVVGARLQQYTDKAFRPLHVMGNNLVRRMVNWVGHAQLTDIMSGYRAMNRRSVARLPIVSSGFEIETEMTLQMLYYRMKIVEVPVPYRERPPGSVSKLRTFHDGFRVLWKIFSLFRSFKPLTFFGGMGILLLAMSLLAGLPPVYDYVTEPDHYVRHVPLAIMAMGLAVLSAGCVFLGILLHVLNWRLMEIHSLLTRQHAPQWKSMPEDRP